MFSSRTLFAAFAISGALLAVGCPSGDGPKTPPADAPKNGGEGDSTTEPDAPAPKPKPFDRATAKTPWKLCKVGDWALYKMVSAGKELRFEITKVEGNSVSFTVTDNKSGKEINNPTIDLADEESRYKDPMTYDAFARDKDGNEIKPYAEKVTINGKEIEALVIKREKSGMGSTELWIAEKDVRPFNQCAIKSIRNGKLEIELIDFGSK